MGKLLDSMQNYFKNGSKEQFLKDWEEMKHLNEEGPDILEVLNRYIPAKPLFTLTAEEVEMVYNTLNGLKILANSVDPAWRISDEDSQTTKIADNLLIRIKEWQDEHNK